MEEKELSSAIKLLEITWRGAYNSPLWSWARLNRCMYDALHLAIEAGLEFELDDFSYIDKYFRWGYWIGDGEGVYCHAVVANNMPAIKAFEHYRKRKPFIVDGVIQWWMNKDTHRNRGRLAIGSKFMWQGERVTVTSFVGRGERITACTYKPQQRDDRGYFIGSLKVEHIYKLTHKDLKS